MNQLQALHQHLFIMVFTLVWFCVSCSSSTESDADLFKDGIHVDILERVGEETIDYIENELEVPIHRGDDPPDLEAMAQLEPEGKVSAEQSALMDSLMNEEVASSGGDFPVWFALSSNVTNNDVGDMCFCYRRDDGTYYSHFHYAFRTYNFGEGEDDYSLDVALWKLLDPSIKMNPSVDPTEGNNSFLFPYHSVGALHGVEAALIMGTDDTFTIFAVMDWDRSDNRSGENQFVFTVSGTAAPGRIDFADIAIVNHGPDTTFPIYPGMDHYWEWPMMKGYHAYPRNGYFWTGDGYYE